MVKFDEIICGNYLKELRNVCRYQLIRYPETFKLSLKQQVKSILKRIMSKNIKIDRFFWPNGLLSIGLEQSHKQTKDQKDLDCLIKYYDNWIENGLKINSLDNIINGYSMIYIYEETKDLKYKDALDSLIEYITNHPTDKQGSLPYRVKSSGDMSDIFIDGLGMICPFLCRYGVLIKNNDIINLAINQLKNFIKYGFDVKKNLPYHSYNIENKFKFGIIGWGRAVGWILLGLVDSLEYIDPTHEDYIYLCDCLVNIVNTSIEYQHYNGYFSWQLEAFEGPIDTSTTSMIAYAIGKGIKIGLLDNSYEVHVKKSIIALYKSTKNGYVGDCSAECKGLSMYPQKYGWYPWSQGLTTALVSMFWSY